MTPAIEALAREQRRFDQETAGAAARGAGAAIASERRETIAVACPARTRASRGRLTTSSIPFPETPLMSAFLICRQHRSSGAAALVRHVLGARSFQDPPDEVPTSDRLRRDVGLPPLAERPVLLTPCGTGLGPTPRELASGAAR